MIYRKMPDKTLDTYLKVKHSADKMAGSTDFSALAALAPGRLNEFSRIALNVFLSGLNNYVNGME